MSLQGNNIPVFATNPQNSGGTLAAATAGSLGSNTNGVTLYTAGSNGSRVYGLFLSTNDVANSVFLYIYNGSTAFPIGFIAVPATAGDLANTPCVDALSPANCPGLPFDGTGKPYVELATGCTLKMAAFANVTAAKSIFGSSMGADY